MNASPKSFRERDQINKPVDAADYVYNVSLSGWGSEAFLPVELNRAELDRYNADPDLFAAKHFGFATAEDYREWIRCDGVARCSERTKSGRLCRVTLGGCGQLNAASWRQRHRSRACAVHSKMEARS